MTQTTEADALFDEADAYQGDPVQPDLDQPTPISLIAALTRPNRELRVTRLIQQAHDIYEDGIAVHLEGRELVASCLLWSGGNDSTVLAHMFRHIATTAIHANTGIGIEETRQFVRDTCKAWGLPLLEKKTPVDYRQQVIENGFPGPGLHYLYYQKLKELALDAARRDLLTNNRKQRLVFIAGRRRQESARRSKTDGLNGPKVPIHERDGSAIWVSPLVMWTSLDMNTYRLMHPDVPRNQVSDVLHMSGECLCGAYAHPGELDEIGYWFPEMKAEIEALEVEVRAAGNVPEQFCTWGHGLGTPSVSGRLCSSCDTRFIPGQTDILEAIA